VALREEIETIRDRALATLNDAHDYYAFTTGRVAHFGSMPCNAMD